MSPYEELVRGRTTIFKRVPPDTSSNLFRDDENTLGDIYNLLENWSYNIDNIVSTVANIAEYMTEEEVNARIAEEAFVEARSIVMSNVYTVILSHVKEACIRSVEYNYEPYWDRLENAIRAHYDEMVWLSFRRDGDHEIGVSFLPLGTVEEWMSAVIAVNEERGQRPNPLASLMWEEKIYGVDREGNKISRYYKRENVTRDVTDRYTGKYSSTIRARLNKIPSDKAPFWYFLQFGTVSVAGDNGGDPYPNFSGYDMIERIGNDLRMVFQENYNRLLTETESRYRYQMENKFKIDYSYDDAETTLSDYIEEEVSDIDVEETFEQFGRKSLEKFTVKTEEGLFEVQPFSSGRRVGYRVYKIDGSKKTQVVARNILKGL